MQQSLIVLFFLLYQCHQSLLQCHVLRVHQDDKQLNLVVTQLHLCDQLLQLHQLVHLSISLSICLLTFHGLL